jgi:hypothetical protein
MSKWEQQESDTRKTFPFDVIYTRKRKLLFGIFIGEWLRVVTYPGMTNKRFSYIKRALINSSKYDELNIPRWKMKLLNFLNDSIHDDIEVMEITETKYIEKYSFLKKHFKDFERERKLKQLGL